MLKVLLVEDEPLMRTYLLNNLTEIHSAFETAACARDGAEALQILLSGEQFDLVITDIKMPRMDGLELASYIHGKDPEIPIVILTGYNEFDYARAALKCGAVDYLLKPLNDAELYNVLQAIAQRRGVAEKDNGKGAQEPENRQNAETTKLLASRAAAYIKSHYQSPLSLNEVADKLGVSAAYLSSVFHTGMGEKYSRYILRLRMERAAQLLRIYSAAKIYDIAHEVGYISPKHFNLSFKKYYGITPNEYKQQVSQKTKM